MSNMLNISNPASINEEFATMAKRGFGKTDLDVKLFCEMFWTHLTIQHRKLYHWVWPVVQDGSGSDDFEAYRIEGLILDQQERNGMYD